MLSNSVIKAMNFANAKHEGQTRKLSGAAYVIHPIEVGSYLRIMEVSEEAVCAGILHDTLEDTTASQDEIRDMFGEKVLNIVLSNTEDKTKSWEERKKHTIENVKNLDRDCFFLLFFDKYSNITDMVQFYNSHGEELWNNFNRGKDKQKWYYESLLVEFIKYASEHDFTRGQKRMIPYMLERYRDMCRILFETNIPSVTNDIIKKPTWLKHWRRAQKFFRAVWEFSVIYVLIDIPWVILEYYVLGHLNPNIVDTAMGALFTLVVMYYRHKEK